MSIDVFKNLPNMEDAISISYFRKYLHFKIFEGSEFCDLSTPEDI